MVEGPRHEDDGWSWEEEGGMGHLVEQRAPTVLRALLEAQCHIKNCTPPPSRTEYHL